MRTYLDIPNGYRLEVGPHWGDYTDTERATICNGVGAAGQPQWLARLLGRLPHLGPASVPHDVDYHHGGDSKDRLRADRRFRRNCFRIAKAKLGPWWKRYLVPIHRARWAFAVLEINAAYAALRLMGRAAWNYTEIEDPAIEAK